MTGSLILEIPGQAAAEKANLLAEGLRGVLGSNEIRVSEEALATHRVAPREL